MSIVEVMKAPSKLTSIGHYLDYSMLSSMNTATSPTAPAYKKMYPHPSFTPPPKTKTQDPKEISNLLFHAIDYLESVLAPALRLSSSSTVRR